MTDTDVLWTEYCRLVQTIVEALVVKTKRELM
jgi:hypothetical protein